MPPKSQQSRKAGLDKEPMGGRWEGSRRSSKRPQATLARRNPDGGFSWSGLPGDLLASLATLAIAAIGFVVVTSYLAEATGEGILLAVVSILVALALPAGLAFWAVRPLHRRRAYHWWLGVFLAPYLLATVALGIAAPARTARVLRWHGAWPARLVDKKGGSAKRMQNIVDWAAQRLAALPRGGGRVALPPSRNEVTAEPLPPPTYLGRLPPAGTSAGIPEDFGRRPGRKVSLKKRSGVWALTAAATKEKRPLSMLLDPGRPWTILSEETAARLGLRVPDKGASVEMQGADRPVLLVPRFFLGGLETKNVALVLCSTCVPSGVSGILGRNVLRRFQVSLDSRKGVLTVTPKKGPLDTPEDIDPFLVLERVSARRTDDALLVAGRIRNVARLPVVGLRLAVRFLDAADHVTQTETLVLGALEPGAEKPIQWKASPPEVTSGFRIGVASGRWTTTGAAARRRRRHRRRGVSPSKTRARGVRASSR